jgi:hypothetical protein
MADVVYLGLGQSSGFDNRPITQVIGQEVALGFADVVRTGLGGPIIPGAREPQFNFNDIPDGPVEVEFEGINAFDVPDPTASPEVEFIVAPREGGQLVGQVFTFDQPSVEIFPSLPPEDVDVTFFEGGPVPPLSLSPQQSEPVSAVMRPFGPSGDDSTIYMPPGSLKQLTLDFPNHFFQTALAGAVVIKGMRVQFLNAEFVDPVVRDQTREILNGTAAVAGGTADSLTLDSAIAGLGAVGAVNNYFFLIGKILVRLTPVEEVILG